MIADKIVIPDQFREYYSENIIFLPNSYQANDDEKIISEKGVTRKRFLV